MPKARLSVVVTRRLPDPVETRMKELFDVRLRDDDSPMSRDELAAAMAEVDVLVPTLTERIDAGLLPRPGRPAQAEIQPNYGSRGNRPYTNVATAPPSRGIRWSNNPLRGDRGIPPNNDHALVPGVTRTASPRG